MRPQSLLTKVGTTTDARSGADVVLVHEPETGATLRTKGRLYFLCEVAPPSAAGKELAREVAELVKDEYYYDLSAGIEVSLRRAMRDANRRAAQRIKEQHGRLALHCACAIVVNGELYAARIGAAQVFLVRRARLFLPGDEPGELADFVHRTTTREAASLGVEADLLPGVWRQRLEPGDTVILAGGALVEGLGADTLKNAAVTLHPRAAAEHVHNRFVAEGVAGSDPALFIELAPAPGSAQRLSPRPERAEPPTEVLIAESIRSRLDAIWRRRPRLGRALAAATAPAAKAVTKTLAVGIELLPRRGPPPLRADETSRERFARQRRVTMTLAALLLVVTVAIGGLVVRDYQGNQVVSDYRLAVLGIEDDIASANRLSSQQRPDFDRARERLASAGDRITQAARSPVADRPQLAGLRAQIDALSDKLSSVLIDLARANAASKPAALAGTVNGVYVADPGASVLWRVFGEPPATEAGAVLQRGQRGVTAPVTVATEEAVVFTIDDARQVWKAEGNTVANVTPADANDRWRSVNGMALFGGNLYVLDAQSGQVWKHEESKTVLGRGIGFLAAALQPNTARSLAVDGDIWIVTSAAEILRYRRNPLTTTANRVDFTVRWTGETPHPSAIQAFDAQRFLYVLDAPARLVIQMTRDGREVARFALPSSLPEPSAFYVAEASHTAYTLHGTKIATTDTSR